jgi:hypothetical protein
MTLLNLQVFVSAYTKISDISTALIIGNIGGLIITNLSYGDEQPIFALNKVCSVRFLLTTSMLICYCLECAIA